MVKDPRAAKSARGLLPLNLPRPLVVEANRHGAPSAVLVHGVLRPVTSVNDRWRIDDEWWRSEISRQYFALELEGGTRITVFQDLMSGAWFSQQYTTPVQMEAG